MPLLIFLNFFFGWIFFKPLMWLAIEGILITIFLLNSYILAKRISKFSSKRAGAIDVEAEIVEDKKRIE